MNEHEEKVIAAFIIKEKRPRYRYALSDPEKRGCHLDHLNHSRDLDPCYVQWLPRKSDVVGLLRIKGCPDSVHIISSDSSIDGRTLPLEEALDTVVSHGWGTIVSCIPGRLAYYYDELGERRALLERMDSTR